MAPSWIWLQGVIVVFVLAGMVIAIVKLSDRYAGAEWGLVSPDDVAGVAREGASHEESGWLLRPREAVEETLEDAAAVFAAAGVEVERYAQRGDPADAILDVAEERSADLIIVGNRGRTGAKRFLLGSVPNRISHHAPCAVLIIRTG